MGDDLDDLLDEIEGEFLEKPRVPHTTSKGESTGGGACLVEQDELDLAIRDICSATELDSQAKGKEWSRVQGQPRPSSETLSLRTRATAKCYPLLLGGSRIATGHSTTSSQRACDRLRCTSCDFRVIYFNDYCWHSRSNYLFFRNNVPDFERLKKNLVRKKDYRAYACQCQWESVHGVLEVSAVTKLRWVCGKHA